MYPIINNNIDYGILNDIPDDNKKICRDICKVSICLTCFCITYLILFLGVIHDELNMNITMIT